MPVSTERIAAPAPNVVRQIDALKRSLATEAANAAVQPTEKTKSRKCGRVSAKCCCRLRAKAPPKRRQGSRSARHEAAGGHLRVAPLLRPVLEISMPLCPGSCG